jgi:SAM-dependent methyltransferase
MEVYFEMEPEHMTSLDSTFFDEFYDGKEDPWGFETRWYESRKRAITLASLPRERYRNGLEVGCATGMLTADLAERCDDLLGIDIAEAPLSRARTRLAGQSQVHFANRATPGEWPEGVFDLVVLSEVGYYWDAGDLATAINRIKSSLAADGTLLLCHWRRPVSEYPLTGDQVHSAVDRDPAFEATVRHVEADFLLTVYLRPPVRSVAEFEGLA